MSVGGRTLDEIRVVILGIVGTALTGTGSPDISVTLTQADDARRVMTGTRACVDGGVSVWRLNSRTTGATIKPNSGSGVQRMTRTVFLVSVALSIELTEGSVVAANLTSLEMQFWNAVEAALEPETGAYTTIEGITLRETVRDTQASDYLIMSLEVTVIHPWMRS